MPGHISRDELWAKIRAGDDFVLLETLAPSSYAYGHLPGALNLPPGEVKRRAHELIPSHDSVVVVYCGNRDCHASTHAADELESLGYTGVLDYMEGKADWKAAGLPMESGPAEPGLA
jgi:rhodanese-related sulfurtransferase